MDIVTAIIKSTTQKSLASVTLNLVLLLILLLCIWSYVQMTFGRTAKLLNKIPHYRKFPLIGNLWIFPRSLEGLPDFLSNGVKFHGRCIAFWLGYKPVVVLLEPQSIQKILSSQKHLEKGSFYKDIIWFTGNSLITSKAEIWKKDRKIWRPAFKHKQLVHYLEIFNKCSHILAGILESLYAGKKVNLHPILNRASMDSIYGKCHPDDSFVSIDLLVQGSCLKIFAEFLMGVPSTFQEDLDCSYLKYLEIGLGTIRDRIMKPYLKLPGIWSLFGYGREDSIVLEEVRKMIDKAIKLRKEMLGEKGNSVVVDGLGACQPPIDTILSTKSDKDSFYHIATIFFAGLETTARVMNYTLYLLANYPEIQDKIHAELDDVFGVNASQLDDVTFNHLTQLTYLEMCLKESLRMYPPAPLITRVLGEDVEVEGGLTIPSGCEVVIPIYTLHRDPAVFPDPENFCPDRFLPENCSTRHPCAYIPFSSGPRNCIGLHFGMMQMKMMLVNILRRYRVSTALKREDIRVGYGAFLELSPTIEVTLTGRGVQLLAGNIF